MLLGKGLARFVKYYKISLFALSNRLMHCVNGGINF